MDISGAMEPEEEKKKLNEDLVVFMRKRSDTEAPRYTARLKTYVDFQRKRSRAATARHHSEHNVQETKKKVREVASKKKTDVEKENKHGSDKPCDNKPCVHRTRSGGGSHGTHSPEPSEGFLYPDPPPATGRRPEEGCGRRRRRRRRSCRRRRRRRSCSRRRRRRKRSCCKRRKRRRRC